MNRDTSPLLGSTDEEDISEPHPLPHPLHWEEGEGLAVNFKHMVIFHGKELAGKSFIRTPQHNLVRISVSREGVFKLDGKQDKILEHWKFSDIKDWSFSGYSFTLQLYGGSDYYVRTDDGEALCSYIEAFKKDPDRTLEKALSNPPVSKIPESGVATLRRKFSAEPSKGHQPTDPSVKFYTLNRRTARKKPADPTSSLPHNIEVDSRLRSSYSDLPRPPSEALDPLDGSRARGYSLEAKGGSMNGLSKEHSRQHAREMLSQKLEQAVQNEKRYSNGIRLSPVSTKGESTKDSPTHSGVTTPLASSSPLLTRKVVAPTEGGGGGGGGGSTIADSNTPQQQSIPEHQTAKKKTHPPQQQQQQQQQPSRGVGSAGVEGRGTRETILSPSDSSSLASNDTAPFLRLGGSCSSSNTSGPFSPTEAEFQYIPSSELPSSDGHANRLLSESTASSDTDSLYDHLEDIKETMRQLDAVELPPSAERRGGSLQRRPPLSMPMRSKPLPSRGYYDDVFNLRDERLSSSSPESGSSGIYDHLSMPSDPDPQPMSLSARNKTSGMTKNLLSPMELLLPRRNISQPALSTPASARESPADPMLRSAILEEPESSDDEPGGRPGGETPTNSDETKENPSAASASSSSTANQIVYRDKKQRHIDPFADLLSSPQSISRLRWSQELNPLYDYIKGVKISDGVKLYDVTPARPSQLATSTHLAGASQQNSSAAGKPTVIIEEELEESSGSIKERSLGANFSVTGGRSEEEEEEEEGGGGKECQMIKAEGDVHLGVSTLPRSRRPHAYEDVMLESPPLERPASELNITRNTSRSLRGVESDSQIATRTLGNPFNRKLRSTELGVSPRLGKRELQLQRRSKTISGSVDDTETLKHKQRPMKAMDNMKDFSFVMREYRMFFIKMPNGRLHREIFCINKPVSELREKLCDLLGVSTPDNYLLYVEGSCLTTLKEVEIGTESSSQNRVNRSGSLTHLVDNQSLPDQGCEPILLKPNLSMRMQGISTSRILSLLCDYEASESQGSYPTEFPVDEAEEFHKSWISIVQGNQPVCQDDAVKLAALQYQAYFLDRTAVHSVVGFCRPTEFLPVEYSALRGIEQKMYKEQEKLKLHTHKEIQQAYINHCAKICSPDSVFFPAREPRKKLLHSTKLKAILIGVSNKGIMRMDPKNKEILDTWDFQVLKNWAYSRRTFVLAFAHKNYPVESNQAKWISTLVDHHVDSLISHANELSQIISEHC